MYLIYFYQMTRSREAHWAPAISFGPARPLANTICKNKEIYLAESEILIYHIQTITPDYT